jgi:cytochrome c-type biogenesis protein CcmH/NrfG
MTPTAGTPRRWFEGLLGLGALLASLSGCAPKQEPRPPIILVSIDTLRSDHLPAYGYLGVHTPAIDALARDGIRFDRAYTVAPLTTPAHASIFSGQLPSAHGLRDNVGYRYPADRLPHLPRLLRESGYATFGAVSAFVLRGEVGFANGFDVYDDEIETRVARGLSGLQRSGQDTLAVSLDWLRARIGAGGPFFFFLHLYEPHAPYAPPPPFDRRYAMLYDGEIAAADAVVGQLLDELRRLGAYDRAAIMLLSDHGEGLGEHGEDGHGVFLYRHDLQVPLILKLPGQRNAGSVVPTTVRLTDVHPTLLSLAGLGAGEAGRQNSLLAALSGARTERPVLSETWTPRLHFGWSELHSLIDGKLHYIHGPDPELFDLDADPREVVNLRPAQRREFARLRSALEATLVPLTAPEAVDADTRRQLAALGYIGSAAAAPDAKLPDPKTMIHTLAALHEGLERFAKQDPAAAARALRQAVDDNPLMVDAWDYLGRSYQQLREPEKAIAAFKEAMRLSGGLPEVALATATALVEVGRPAEARLVLDGQIARSPEDLRLRYLKVRLLLLDGLVEPAQALAVETLKVAPESADANYQMGSVAMMRRDLAEAERYLRRALELDPNHTGSLSDLSVLLASTGRATDAVPLAERLVNLSPADTLAQQNLRHIREAAGRPR